MLNYVTSRSDLPDKIKDELKKANVYYSEGYEEFCKKAGKNIVFFYSDIYVWMSCIKKIKLFVIAELPTEPFCIGDIQSNKTQNDISAFLSEACIIMKEKLRVHWAGPVQNQAIFLAKPDKSTYIPFGNYVIDLSLSEEELWSNVHSKHRNVIRKAEKDGLEVVFGNSEDLLKQYLDMDAITWARSNKKSYTEKTVRDMLKYSKDNVIIYIVKKDNVNQGGAIFYYNKKMSYYLYGASIDKPSTGAMNYLHWKAILDMKKDGVEKYSFVGCRINEDADSKYHTIQRFKERFGGELIQGYMFKCIFNKSMYILYKLLKCVKERRKFNTPMDIIDQELWKWNGSEAN